MPRLDSQKNSPKTEFITNTEHSQVTITEIIHVSKVKLHVLGACNSVLKCKSINWCFLEVHNPLHPHLLLLKIRQFLCWFINISWKLLAPVSRILYYWQFLQVLCDNRMEKGVTQNPGDVLSE